VFGNHFQPQHPRHSRSTKPSLPSLCIPQLTMATPTEVVAAIKDLTKRSQALEAPAQSINLINGPMIHYQPGAVPPDLRWSKRDRIDYDRQCVANEWHEARSCGQRCQHDLRRIQRSTQVTSVDIASTVLMVLQFGRVNAALLNVPTRLLILKADSGILSHLQRRRPCGRSERRSSPSWADAEDGH
jgi:hypothetical protein